METKMKKINEYTKSGYVAFVKNFEALALCGDLSQRFLSSDPKYYVFSSKESLEEQCSEYNNFRTKNNGLKVDFEISYCEITIIVKKENKNENS